jgi:hypothetical protein
VIDIVRRHIIPAAFAVLPPEMASKDAAALLLAIGWQESRFEHRLQVGGPARGFWQFEEGGAVKGVINHKRTEAPLRAAMKALSYRFEPTPRVCYEAIAHNDVLACVFARLLLWTVPGELPSRTHMDYGWRCYLAGWRPGKPHPDTWAQAWEVAWRS